jgi:DegV family protein with EDD domain
VRYWFTVDDLIYLKRGGRISKTTQVVGTLLNIKPLLTMTRAGKLISADKQKGRKKAIRQLVQNLAAEIVDPEHQVVSILQADCLDDARTLASYLEEKVPGIRYRIEKVGPTICTHAGPGTLAVVFLGEKRDRP